MNFRPVWRISAMCPRLVFWTSFRFFKTALVIPIACLLVNGQAMAALISPQQPQRGAQQESFRTAPPLKVTKILFYSSGVAQIIHSGKVNGNVETELRFGAHDIDDALKSLVLDDPNGESQVVVYPTAPSPEQFAAEDFKDPLTLAQTFQQFRGEAIRFKHNNILQSGTIYVVENRRQGEEIVETVVVLSENGLMSFPIAELTEIRFANLETAKKFSDALAGLRLDRDPTNRKKMVLQFKGQGEREVRFSYLVDGPIWRITYRLIMENEKATLQSWVHLDNVFGYDWENVEIELRNGRPDAFHAELFAPILAERRNLGLSVFEIPTDVTLVTQWYGMSPTVRFDSLSGNPSLDSSKLQGFGMGGGGMGGGMGGMGGMARGMARGDRDKPTYGLGAEGDTGGGAAERPGVRAKAMEQSPFFSGDQTPEALLDPRRLHMGGDSQFHIHGSIVLKLKDRVSLRSGSSAVVPVFTQDFPAQKITRVEFANDSGAKKIGSLQIEITNVGETPLLTGPIAIFENGSFIGDGFVRRTVANEKLVVDYGADLESVISLKFDSSASKPIDVTLEEQLIKVKFEGRRALNLDIANHHPQPRFLRVSLPNSLRDKLKWTRIDPPMEFADETCALLELNIAAREKVVREHTLVREWVESYRPITALTQVEIWKKADLNIPPEVTELLEQVRDVQTRLKIQQEKVAGLRDNLKFLEAEQLRLSKLVETTKVDLEVAKGFLESIRAAEQQLMETRQQLKTESDTLKELETEFVTFS